jgi:hypothetical protein
MRRYASVKHKRSTPEQIARYLPDNYRIAYTADDPELPPDGLESVIVGEDAYGWTLDDYVIPRLGSGLYWATELDPDDARVKAIPPRFGVVANMPDGYLIEREPTYADNRQDAEEAAADLVAAYVQMWGDGEVERAHENLWYVSTAEYGFRVAVEILEDV